MIIRHGANSPVTGPGCFLAPDSWLIGDVVIENDCSVFFGAVLRGDINPIRIGPGSNIQEHSVLHTSHGLGPCIVGKNVTIGHRAILHGCEIKDNCLIGMGSTILDGAVIGENSIVGANSLVTMNKIIPPGSMVIGSPARVVRETNEADLKQIQDTARRYQRFGKDYIEILGC